MCDKSDCKLKLLEGPNDTQDMFIMGYDERCCECLSCKQKCRKIKKDQVVSQPIEKKEKPSEHIQKAVDDVSNEKGDQY